MTGRRPFVGWLVIAELAMAAAAHAQTETSAAAYTATPAASAIHVDGRLDESAWASARVLTDFRQVEPAAGAASRFRTIVRVAYDSTNLYVAVDCRDSLGSRGVRVQDLRRKFDYFQNDVFGVSIDALHDGRSVAAFQITPYGTQRELQVLDDVVYNREWEAVWHARTVVTDSGWTAEIAIPWRTLRYRDDGAAWNVNFYRIARRANETSAWVPWPRNATAYRIDYAGRLAGLAPPPPRADVRIRPYLLGAADSASRTGAGGELTWAPTTSSVLDLTYNTDFAQAEVDRQVINTTRFSVFFPERRQFFLESASLFELGPSSIIVRPFISRRIGLDASGRAIPLDGGARFVRRDASGGDGLLVMHQKASSAGGPATFGAARSSRNIGPAGRVGALVATRFTDSARDVVAAVDGFSRFGPSVSASGMLSHQPASATHGSGSVAWATINRSTPTLYTLLDVVAVTRDYNPPTGFVSRADILMVRSQVGYDFRPSWKPPVFRRFYPNISSAIYHRLSDGHVGDRFIGGYVDFAFQNGALVYPNLGYSAQEVIGQFRPVHGVTIGPGTYPVWRGDIYAATDQSARYAGQVILSTGGYFDRARDDVVITVRASPAPHAAFVLGYDLNRFRGAPNGDRTVVTHLLSPEARLALNPRVQLATFYQYNTDAATGSLNARLSWEFAPLSYVYLVTNDARAIGGDAGIAGPSHPTQQVVLKVVWLRQL